MPNPSPNQELIYNKALSLLSRREHSRHELALKLKKRFPDAFNEIEEALNQLEAKKYLVNQRYAEMMVRHRAAQGYGPNYIRQELKAQKVSLDEAYLKEPEIEDTFFEGWRRKFKTRFKVQPQSTLEQAKMMRYFLQRGYLREQITAFLTQVNT